jgi:hypothetical protein
LVSNVEAKINGEMPALTTRLGKNQEDTLRYLLIDQYCGLILERVSRFLYGSQIDALIFRNANNNRVTRDEIKRFYDTATSSFPDVYKNYSFDRWLAFLENNGIIGTADNIVGATSIGKALIAYMQMRGYLVTRAPG